MAVKIVVAVLDKASASFMNPWFALHEQVAIRDFVSEAMNPESIIHKHAKDFSLYKFGTFDDADGKFEMLREPQFIMAANGLASNQVALPLGEQQ